MSVFQARAQKRRPALLLLTASTLLGTLALWGCGRELILPEQLPPTDSGPDAGDADADADIDADADADADEDAAPPRPGSWTVVVNTVTVVPDRVCDIDGVAPADNSLQSLGAGVATEVATTLSTSINQRIASNADRFMFHAPWCDNLNIPYCPAFRIFMLSGLDEDGNPDDDFSGSEPFAARSAWLTDCGEGIFAATGSIRDGELNVTSNRLQLPFVNTPLPFRSAQLFGTVADGVEVTMTLCGHVRGNDLAQITDLEPVDRNLLELVIFPEQARSNPDITGIQPDIDNDGDGLEEYRVAPTTGQLASCIDGDGTELAGRDCWSLPEMADSFSLTVELTATPAVFTGCEPGWETLATRPCADTPERALCEIDGGDAGPDADVSPDGDLSPDADL